MTNPEPRVLEQVKSHATEVENAEKPVPIVDKVDYSGAHEKTDPKEIALVKKLDRWIMPMLWSMYWLNYLDRNAIALARLNNLEKDLNLKGEQYQTCVSILFVGYILGQVPSNMFITRTRPSRYMGIMMMLWAVVSALTAVAHDYIGLLLTRFFLGLTESPYYPRVFPCVLREKGAVYILSLFYTRKEVATRIAILYTGNILATAFAGLIAAGIFHGMDGLAGLAGWKWLFILQGAVTFVIALVGFFLLPDTPLTTKWLTQEERDLAYNRMELDTVDNKGETDTLSGLKQAAKDPLVWIFAFMAHLHLAANGFKNFFPTVVKTLGFNQTITLVLTCPPYLIAGAVTILVSWSSGKFNERTWHITASKAVATIGFVAAGATLNLAGRYVSMVIFTIGTYGVNSLILAWCGSVCGQTKEKKAVAISIVTMIMNISFVWTPYLWPSSDEPRYLIAMASSAAFSVATALTAWVARFICQRKNREIRAREDETTNFYVY
uniref:Major facilitator superfamily (MFS) profile domain-containing protein n=1 Tax=Bionectria ochroleuca TaxID=29856 RepID=A0A8H7N8Q9_BIOOC